MFTVIEAFADLQDFTIEAGKQVYHFYHEGDTYPRAGKDVSEARLEELSTAKNRMKRPLIQPVEVVLTEDKATPTTKQKTPRKPRKRATKGE